MKILIVGLGLIGGSLAKAFKKFTDYDIIGYDKDEKVLENQKVLLTPIVRNGKQATVGYKPEIWKDWK